MRQRSLERRLSWRILRFRARGPGITAVTPLPRIWARSGSGLFSLVKIATYNVNSIDGRMSVLLRQLAKAEPDIVCLQKLKAPDERFPERPIRELVYNAIWHGQKSWNGVAILSRVGKIHEMRRWLPGDPDDTHSRYIEAAVTASGRQPGQAQALTESFRILLSAQVRDIHGPAHILARACRRIATPEAPDPFDEDLSG